MDKYRDYSDAEPSIKRRSLEDRVAWLLEKAQDKNYATKLPDDYIQGLGERVVREFNIDNNSRSDWEKVARAAMDAAGMKVEPKNYPFQKASNVKFPSLITATLQFAARAYPAIVDGPNVVKARVLGKDPDGEKRTKALRISSHMSYQILHEMEEWEEGVDTLLHQIPVVGCAFKKVYRSEERGRSKADLVSAFDLVVNQATETLDNVPRITHKFKLYPHEIEERKRAGIFLDQDLGLAENGSEDRDSPHIFLEQHRLIDLDEDGYTEPWIVTVHEKTRKVVRIVANYDPDTIQIGGREIIRIPRNQYFVKYSFFPDPEGGFYDIGWGKLLKPLSDVIDSSINQMMDAGHLQNSGGGFIGSGLNLKRSQLRFSPGKYHAVNAAGSTIRDAIVNLEHPGPSPVLFQLLGLMMEAVKDVTSVQDILTGDDGGRQQTATTTLALIEQGMKVFTAIYKRIYRSLRREFKMLFKLNARYLDDQVYFNILDDEQAVARTDYDVDSYDVLPVADPRIVTDMQKMARAQLLRELIAEQNPTIDPHAATRRILEAASIEDIDEIIAEPPTEPSPEEQLALEERTAAVQKTKSETAKNAAQAEKTEAEAEQARNVHEAEIFGQQVASDLNEFEGADA